MVVIVSSTLPSYFPINELISFSSSVCKKINKIYKLMDNYMKNSQNASSSSRDKMNEHGIRNALDEMNSFDTSLEPSSFHTLGEHEKRLEADFGATEKMEMLAEKVGSS